MVVIPSLNEAESVATTVRSWLALGAAQVRVVDNGSTDATADFARSAGAEVRFEPQRGYGAAAWRSLENWPEAIKWVLFSAADGSDCLSTADLSLWQEAVNSGTHLIVGDRVTMSESRLHLKLGQRFGNWLTCEGIRAIWGHRFRDMGSLRLIRHASLTQLELADRGFGWNVEMQVRTIEHGFKIVELPVRYHPRQLGESKISGSFVGTVRAGWGIVRMLLWLGRLRRTAHLRSTYSVARVPR